MLRARPNGMTPVARVLTSVLFGVCGAGPLVVTVSAVLSPVGGAAWPALLAAKLFVVLTLGGLGTASLMCAYLAAFRPAELTGGTVPPAVSRLCAGCGAALDRDEETCPRCGLARAWAPWRRQASGPISSLFGAAVLGGIAFIGVALLAAMASASYRADASTIFLLMAAIATLLFGSFGAWHFVDAWRTERVEKKHYAATPVRFPISTTLTALTASAWVDDADEVERASGASWWREPSPEGELDAYGNVLLLARSITWSRSPAEPLVQPLVYRDGAGGERWTCEERTAFADAASEQPLDEEEEAVVLPARRRLEIPRA